MSEYICTGVHYIGIARNPQHLMYLHLEIPQYILGTRSHKFVERARMVGITQPRRVAAVTIAKRVAKEMRVKVGTKVSVYRAATL